MHSTTETNVLKMTEFERKLTHAIHDYKRSNKISTMEVAARAGVNRQSLYNFLSGGSGLSSENINKLMDELKLTVELKEANK